MTDSPIVIAEKIESGDLPSSTRAGRMEMDLHTEALAAAAIGLRDAELALKAARERYAAALQAFNRYVAPVG